MNKHIIVIGASRGFGLAAAESFAKLDWNVSIGARSESAIASIVESLRDQSLSVFGKSVDVADSRTVDEFFKSSCEEFGAPSAVVFAAGKFGPFGKLESIAEESWVENISINLLGAFFVLKQSISRMRLNGGGRIVLLSGGGATAPMAQITAYSAAKAGLVRLVESAALEVLDDNIFINALAPGVMQTDMVTELLDAGESKVPLDYLEKMSALRESGEDSLPIALEALHFLIHNNVPGLSGRLISAKWDDWETWDKDSKIFTNKDLYTLRRKLD